MVQTERSGRAIPETAAPILAPTADATRQYRHLEDVALDGDKLIIWTDGFLAGDRLGRAESYDAGYRDALEAVAANVLEIDLLGAGWREVAKVTAEDRYQARLASMPTASGASFQGVSAVTSHGTRRDLLVVPGGFSRRAIGTNRPTFTASRWRQDSNLQHPVLETGALPVELRPYDLRSTVDRPPVLRPG